MIMVLWIHSFQLNNEDLALASQWLKCKLDGEHLQESSNREILGEARSESRMLRGSADLYVFSGNKMFYGNLHRNQL